MPWLEYTGPKPLPYVVPIPCPLEIKSEQIGTIQFNPRAAVEQDIADYLLTLPVFREVNGDLLPAEKKPKDDLLVQERIRKSIGLKFKTKWKLRAFLKQKGLEGLVEAKRNRKTTMWEIIGEANLSHPVEDDGGETVPISAEAEGGIEVSDERDADEGRIENGDEGDGDQGGAEAGPAV